MLVEFEANTVDYDVYGNSKMSSLPYDSSPDLIKDVLKIGKKKRRDETLLAQKKKEYLSCRFDAFSSLK